MDKKDEALKLALETAEGIANSDWRKWEELASPEEFERWVKSRALHMATALREALSEQPAQQEPVAWMCSDESLVNKGYSRFSRTCEGAWNIPVYTSPPESKPWMGLTDEEYSQLHDGLYQQGKSLGWVVDQVEATLREKNA